MVKIRRAFPKHGTWGELSDKVVKHLQLPNGSRLALSRKDGSSGSRPYVRADYEVRRKLFRGADHPRLDDTRVIDVCDAVEAMLAPSSRSTVVAFGPDGQKINGKMSLRRWRSMDGRPTQQQRDAAEIRKAVIEELRHLSDRYLAEIEEAVENPDSEVTEAMIRALADRYGGAAVRNIYQSLKL